MDKIIGLGNALVDVLAHSNYFIHLSKIFLQRYCIFRKNLLSLHRI